MASTLVSPHFLLLGMAVAAILAALVLFRATPVKTFPGQDYLEVRNNIIKLEESRKIGGKPTSALPALSDSEKKVDEYIMAMKSKMIEEARTEGTYFAPSVNFMTSRPHMESTDIFKVIKKMPKGGALHLHVRSTASIDWVMANVTYRPHLYMCVEADYNTHFHFYDTPPPSSACKWQLVSAYREGLDAAGLIAFDQSLRNNLSMVRPDPDKVYPDLNTTWAAFGLYVSRPGGLLFYRPVFRDYLMRTFQEFLADGVQYLEIRIVTDELYELDQSKRSNEWVIENVYRPVIREFKERNPDFIGAKLIYTSYKGSSPATVQSFIEKVTELWQKYPDLVVGADVAGNEDTNHPLIDFKDQLLYPSLLNPPVNLPYYFHAGETVWLDTAADWNLVDAILLNSRRIGHAFALHKHPLLTEMVRERDIAIEVNPISNQVLRLVADLRNHPVTALIADNMPVVISSDNFALWDALPLSHDYYVTFLALTGKDAGLATLKQLILNSFTYSAMNATEKADAVAKWQKNWDAFIEDTANNIQ